jgi:acetyl-CoA synthetase
MTGAPNEIVHQPSQEFVESTNVWTFMQDHDIETYEELIGQMTTDLDDVPDSGVEWFWDELVNYLDVEFYEPYDQVRDNTDGPQFTDWYVGGALSSSGNLRSEQVVVSGSHDTRRPAQRDVRCGL